MYKSLDIKDIFTIFHDGCIADYKILNKDLLLVIEISYLAELIDASFKFIHLKLIDLKAIHFEPWTGSISEIRDVPLIFSYDLCIVSTEKNPKDITIVHCNSYKRDQVDFEGGKLVIDCNDYLLTDQVGNSLTIEYLKELSSRYWNDFGNKN